MALYIICVFYELFLKWNSSWVFFNKSKSNTHLKVLCVINFIKETLWIAFKYFLQWCGKSFSVQLSSFTLGCQRFPARGVQPRRGFLLEPLALQDVPARWHCCSGTKVLWHSSCAVLVVPQVFGCLWAQLEGRVPVGDVDAGWHLLPSGQLLAALPCPGLAWPAWGAWHGPVQCNIPKAAQCQCWQFCHTVPGSALGTVCGVMGQKAVPAQCLPMTTLPGGWTAGPAPTFYVDALKLFIFSCCCFGFFIRNSARSLCRYVLVLTWSLW